MESINDYYLPQMQNGEVVAFHNDSLTEMETAAIGKWFPKRMDDYRAGVTNLKITLDVFAASELSPLAQMLDTRRDKYWSAFKAYIKLCMNDDDHPEVEAAAERVMFIIRNAVKDVGDPLVLGVTKESTAIESIARSLEPATAELELTGATGRLAKLVQANKEFMALQIDRDTEKGVKPSGDMKAARAIARGAYKELVGDINARIRLHKDAELQAFVKTHNATIEKHRNIVAQRKGRGKGGSTTDQGK